MPQQELTTRDTLPPASDVATVKCDQEGCAELATLAYRWDWGATGVCCSTHGALLQQAAGNLQRGIVVHPLAQAAPLPLLRDERIQLIATQLVTEAELNEARSRGLELYRKNGDLQVQLNTAVVRERELKAQLKDANEKLATSEQLLDLTDKENGRLLVELERLRSLETFVAERDAHERGLEPPTTVDG